VTALVAAFAGVKRLMNVADKVDDEAQRGLLVGTARVRVLQHLAEFRQRLERVARRRRMVIDDAVEGYIVPWARLLLPEGRRIGAHVVGPGRGFVEALAGAEDLLDVG